MPYEETTMSDQPKIYPVPEEFAAKANLSPEKYKEMYEASIADPEAFWGEHGKRLDWIKPYTKVKDVSFDDRDLHIRWYRRRRAERRGQLHRPAPRHARRPDGDHLGRRRPGRGHKSPTASCTQHVCRFANVLKSSASRRATASRSTCR